MRFAAQVRGQEVKHFTASPNNVARCCTVADATEKLLSDAGRTVPVCWQSDELAEQHTGQSVV